MSRCTGHCCRCFTLPLAPDELQTLAAEIAKGPPWDGAVAIALSLRRSTIDPQLPFIADMVIPLETGDPRLVSAADARGRDSRSYYTCRHLDATTGDCTVYEQRPNMCRSYPYGDICQYAGCTAREDLDKARAGAAPITIIEPRRE